MPCLPFEIEEVEECAWHIKEREGGGRERGRRERRGGGREKKQE
jgi:hypothetical protein